PEYIGYARQDVRVTWECFEILNRKYESYGLSITPVTHIYSEAGIGKAYLKEMGIKPWRELQPDFSPKLIGAIMSAYYGGRAEFHIRRKITRLLLCDFLSMSPTVCTLMVLWRFVVAEKILWQNATAETQAFLEAIRPEDMQTRETWALLTTIVQIQ